MYPEYKSKSITAKTVAEVNRSDGKTAYEITNFDVDEYGFLTSRFNIMPLIPNQWNESIPSNFGDVIGFASAYFDGGARPELLIFTGKKTYRYAPWTRTSGGIGTKGLEEVSGYRQEDNSSYSVAPSGTGKYPVQSEVIGDRVYFSFCDGGGIWVWDGYKARSFGFERTPSPPSAMGPTRYTPSGNATQPNGGGFSNRGRIGTIDSGLHNVRDDPKTSNRSVEVVVGGLSDGEWTYYVAFENADGAYSSTSLSGGICTVRNAIASNPEATDPTFVDSLRRQFLVYDIPTGPTGTTARVLLRTPDTMSGRSGLDTRPRYLHRIPNNIATEYVDNIPDGELGQIWEDREQTPIGVYFIRSFGGSLFQLRTDSDPSRVWWSEQTSMRTPEGVLSGHYLDVFPATGAITGSIPITVKTASGRGSNLLIFKEAAVHFLSGQYPDWGMGTLHNEAGLAGPSLVQSTPDDNIVWYGNNTFWLLDSAKGNVIDVGQTMRESLSRVNRSAAGKGVSWIRPDTKEVVFSLPMDDSEVPNMLFVWDYRFGGFRMRDNITVKAATTLKKEGITLLSGTVSIIDKGGVGDATNVWIENRGYPAYVVSPPTAVFSSGWVSMTSLESANDNYYAASMRMRDSLGTSVHASSNVNDLIVLMREENSGSASVSTYQDWDRDNAVDADSLSLSHPEQLEEIPFYGSASYNSDLYRDRRTYQNRTALGIASSSVFQVKISTESPMSILSVDVYGPTVSLPGGRTPQ